MWDDENEEDEINQSMCESGDYLADRHRYGVSTDGAGARQQSRTAEEQAQRWSEIYRQKA